MRSPERRFPGPRWDGSPLAGRELLLWCEQGLGDAIQFARYVPQVKSRGGAVHLLCQPQLKCLFEGQLQLDSVTSDENSLPQFDVQLPLMSLPRVLGEGNDILADVPYIAVTGTNSHLRFSPNITGGAGVFGPGVSFAGTTTTNSTVDVSGIDPAACTSSVKLQYNSGTISATGVFGTTNLAQGNFN